MEITWEGIVFGFFVLVIVSFVAGFVDVYFEDRKRRKEQAEREAWQSRGKTEA